MLKNYIKVALRNLLKNKIFSFINIFGLAMGLSICMLLTLIINDQRSFDHFHPDEDRLYRVVSDRTSRNSSTFATAPLPLYEKLTTEMPAVEKALRIHRSLRGDFIFGDKNLPLNGLFTEPAFFELFGFEFVQGSAKNALSEPNTIILTQASAKKFGIDEAEAVGKVLELSGAESYTITGILKDPEQRTHLRFDALASLSSLQARLADQERTPFNSWSDTNNGFLYFRLRANSKPSDIQKLFPAISEAQYAAMENYRLDFQLQKVTDIMPPEMRENDLSFGMPFQIVVILSIFAFLIILTAAFNYTNLSIARSLYRAREIGVRKVIGAHRIQVILQFVVEAIVLAIFSMLIAWGILEVLILPQFKSMFFSRFFNLELEASFSIYLQFLGLAILVGLLAGAFPAIFLSKFKPIEVLTRLKSLSPNRKWGLRKILIVVQFVLSLVFIISSTFLNQQSAFMLQADYGFDKEYVLNLALQGNDFELVKNELQRDSRIEGISGSSLIPATGSNQADIIRLPGESDVRQTHILYIDDSYIQNMKLEILAGKGFDVSTRAGSDSAEQYVVINEQAVTAFGFNSPEQALGKQIFFGSDPETAFSSQVIGVVKDFHYRSLLSEIGTLVLRNRMDGIRWANIRLNGKQLAEGVAFVEESWTEIDAIHDLSMDFHDAQIAETLITIKDSTKVVGFISFIAIVIACLGLLGISAYQAESRLKEISIRKILGASPRQIVYLLSRGFLLLLLVAVVIALPLTWWLTDSWLSQFAYSINMNLLYFGWGVFLMLALGALTIGSQALSAALRNPIDALRAE